MANEENLKKGVLTQFRTGEEQAKTARKGGMASGEARRRKATLRDTMHRLLTMQVEVPELSDVLKADGVDSTYEDVIAMAMIQRAMLGDTKAYKEIRHTIGQTDKSELDLEEQRIRTDRAKRARDQEVGDMDTNNENIQNFLRAMNPTKEDLDSLFAEENQEEGDNNAEETEETG